MSELRKAAEEALELLNDWNDEIIADNPLAMVVIENLKEALAQPEQEEPRYGKFQAMAQGVGDYTLQAFPVTSEDFGTMICIGATEEAVYVTEAQAKKFFALHAGREAN